jgi:predicted ArsR family transcriptional regulator
MQKIPNRPIGKTDAMKKPAKPKASSETGATRAAVLDLLKRNGELCASTLGPMLGRPLKYWSLTEASARVFPDAHQALAVEMIKSVEDLFGAEGLAKFVKKHGQMQRAAYGEKLATAKTLGERVKRLADARSAEGYMAEAQKDGRDWLLIENHCPICSAARACTGLCAGELKVFSDVLGKDVSVTREEHILSGARRCAYRVRGK